MAQGDSLQITPIAATDFSAPIQAFLIALSYGESEHDADSYTELCGGDHFDGFATFPDWQGIGDPISHAAGRYQFEPATWREMAGRLGLTDFSPTSQDHAAWGLASEVYQRTGRILLDDLHRDDLAGIAAALRSTWTSVNSEFPARYRGALDALQSTSTPDPLAIPPKPLPAPADVPDAPVTPPPLPPVIAAPPVWGSDDPNRTPVWVIPAFGLMIVVIFSFTLLAVTFYIQNDTLQTTMFGAAYSAFMMAVGYYFGSSAGSKSKDSALANSTPVPVVAVPVSPKAT